MINIMPNVFLKEHEQTFAVNTPKSDFGKFDSMFEKALSLNNEERPQDMAIKNEHKENPIQKENTLRNPDEKVETQNPQGNENKISKKETAVQKQADEKQNTSKENESKTSVKEEATKVNKKEEQNKTSEEKTQIDNKSTDKKNTSNSVIQLKDTKTDTKPESEKGTINLKKIAGDIEKLIKNMESKNADKEVIAKLKAVLTKIKNLEEAGSFKNIETETISKEKIEKLLEEISHILETALGEFNTEINSIKNEIISEIKGETKTETTSNISQNNHASGITHKSEAGENTQGEDKEGSSKDKFENSKEEIKLSSKRNASAKKVETEKSADKNINVTDNFNGEKTTDKPMELKVTQSKTDIETTEVKQNSQFKAYRQGESAKVQRNINENIMPRFAKSAHVMLKEGKSEMRISLRPKYFGDVSMKLSLEGDSLTGKIIVDNPSVREMFEQNISLLRNELAKEGIDVGAFDVSLGSNSEKENEGKKGGEKGSSFGKNIHTEEIEIVREVSTRKLSMVI